MQTDYEALAKFRELCGVSLLLDENGNNPILCVSANLQGKEYKRCVALTPVMEMLAKGIRRYHDMLHAENISGMRYDIHGEDIDYDVQEDIIDFDDMEWVGGPIQSYSRAIRRRRGSPRIRDRRRSPSNWTARLTKRRMSPRRMEELPEADMEEQYDEQYDEREQLVDKAQQMQAPQQQGFGNTQGRGWDKEYDPDSFEGESEGYYDILPPGVDPMQVQGWFDSIKKIARQISESKAVKTLYKDVIMNRKLQAVALSAVASPAAGAALLSAYAVYDNVLAAKAGSPVAVSKLTSLADAAAAGNPAAQTTLEAARNINNKLNQKAASQQVSGWLYNRPYRTNLDMVTAPLRNEFPSIGLALRQGWHDGLNFAKTMQRRPLFQLGI